MTMPTYYVFEGVGTDINFQTSRVRFAIESFSLPDASREAIETTHLKSTAKTFMPAALIDYGTISIQYQNDPSVVPRMINRAAETIEVIFPLAAGQVSPARMSFSGFVSGQKEGDVKVGEKIMGELTIKISGEVTTYPGA